MNFCVVRLNKNEPRTAYLIHTFDRPEQAERYAEDYRISAADRLHLGGDRVEVWPENDPRFTNYQIVNRDGSTHPTAESRPPVTEWSLRFSTAETAEPVSRMVKLWYQVPWGPYRGDWMKYGEFRGNEIIARIDQERAAWEAAAEREFMERHDI